ncbi:hypothetical protein EDD15DRAFT_1812511 [Pisolithus albus]|nr:hypothetical protein EDD15DRAFT_1812511 [Pisolithus albus]
MEDCRTSLTVKLSRMDTSETNIFDISDDTLPFLLDKKIGILGTGVCGLYAALILASPDAKFEILEASDDVGGRLSTLKFFRARKYDYCDAGAMCYPLLKKS